MDTLAVDMPRSRLHALRAAACAVLALACCVACDPADGGALAHAQDAEHPPAAASQVIERNDPTAELDREAARFFCLRYNLRAPAFQGAVPLREILRDFGTESNFAFANRPELRATLQSIVGMICAEQGQYPAAELLLRGAITEQARSIGGFARATLRSEVALSRVLQSSGRSDEVRRSQAGLTNDVRGTLGEQDPIRLSFSVLRMALELENARLAADLDNRAWVMISKVQSAPDVPPTTRALAYGNLAQALVHSERIDEGLRAAERAVADATSELGPLHPVTLDLRVTRGLVLEKAGKLGGAADELSAALALQEVRLGREHPSRIRGLRAAIRTRALSGRAESAAAAARELLDVLGAQPRLDITLKTAATAAANEILAARAGDARSGG